MNLGIEPVIHFSCKDKNRNTMESQLFELDRTGLRNLLVLTGDYPRHGFSGVAKPVFDLDSVQALRFIHELGQGFHYTHRPLSIEPLPFYAGCVVSPFKRQEAEQVFQYVKLVLKVSSGAAYVVSQMGFDASRHHELRLFMDTFNLDVPLLGTVLIPDVRLARIIKKGIVPGCIMPGRLLQQIEQEATGSDGGLGARLERAARQIALLGGLGYEGVHVSGPGLSYAEIATVIHRAYAIAAHWQDYLQEFLYPEEWNFRFYRKDPATGLNLKEMELTAPGQGGRRVRRFRLCGIMERNVHKLFFTPGRAGYDRACRAASRISGSSFEDLFTRIEYMVKGILYSCQHCGDCSLAEMEFLCPQSQCAKFMLNGPCGGSSEGWCEVWPGKRRCIYVRLYERLEDPSFRRLMDREYMPPRNWALFRTSSWLNFFLGRDHHALMGKNEKMG
jgi:methylenetetrahydrofolate reductase (NADPH)